MKTLSKQQRSNDSTEKCEHGVEPNECVPCALLEGINRKQTRADFDREKRQYHKLQEINNIIGWGK